MKTILFSAVAVLGLLYTDSSANAQVIIGARVPGVAVGVGIGAPGYYAPPYAYAPRPAVVYPYGPPAVVGVGVGPVIGPVYRPYYGYYGPHYRHFR